MEQELNKICTNDCSDGFMLYLKMVESHNSQVCFQTLNCICHSKALESNHKYWCGNIYSFFMTFHGNMKIIK
jgi:hypothetical protein